MRCAYRARFPEAELQLLPIRSRSHSRFPNLSNARYASRLRDGDFSKNIPLMYQLLDLASFQPGFSRELVAHFRVSNARTNQEYER